MCLDSIHPVNVDLVIKPVSVALGFEQGNNGFKELCEGFPGGTVVENLPAKAGDTGSSPGLGGSHMPWSN